MTHSLGEVMAEHRHDNLQKVLEAWCGPRGHGFGAGQGRWLGAGGHRPSSARGSRSSPAPAQATATDTERSAALARLQAIIDSMAGGVIYVGDDDRIALVNQAGRVLRNLEGGPGGHLEDCHPLGLHALLESVLRYVRLPETYNRQRSRWQRSPPKGGRRCI